MLSNGNTASATLTLNTLPPSGSPTVTLAPQKPPNIYPLFYGRGGLGAAAWLLCLLWLFRPRGMLRYRVVTVLTSFCVLGFLLSCGAGGGGNGIGGGGGGGQVQVSTSVTLTTSGIKVPSTSPPTIQAKVNSTNAITGSVTFYDLGTVVNVSIVLPDGTATMGGFSPYPGTHVITASYSGDGNNLPSKTSGPLNQVITGTIYTGVQGATGGFSSGATIPITIQ